VVVTFYLSGPTDDSQVRSSINKLESRFKGQADFYLERRDEDGYDLLRRGLTLGVNRELARRIGLSEHTIRRKLGEWGLKRDKR